MDIDPQVIQQINGDMRIDDGDEGPLLELRFHAEFKMALTDKEKALVMDAVIERLDVIAKASEALLPQEEDLPPVGARRAAVAATKQARLLAERDG